MITPWGPLAELDLSEHDLAARILAADKHQLVEGLVVECLFDQIVSNIPSYYTQVLALDVETVIVDTRRQTGRWVAFVWARTREPGLGRYLQSLGKGFDTYLLDFSGDTFLAARVRNGQRVSDYGPLPDLMRNLSGGRYTPFEVNTSVRNTNRQRQAFWGFLSEYYGKNLASRIVLPRLLINCAIQPYFRSLWNLDRVFVSGDDIWIFEIKHKFPIDRNGLSFGINDGELRMLDRLATSGISCLHTILAKPFWSKEVGSMYLLNDLAMRTRAGLIAKVLDAAQTAIILKGSAGTSGAHTSINGASSIKFRTMPADQFCQLGVLSDTPAALAANIVEVMLRHESPKVNEAWLRSLRAQPS
ncbi:hypothetical protein [Duganella radicis]|uniref:Uncharacterized protein n=1 Tax=Duganella radicis TaxID=551988 RepID=A0A6L6PRZ2_9BURK|nr:hypothetical protein [Duganella radicis]MTV41407.1 hypothetical protein [Duganella radicis]